MAAKKKQLIGFNADEELVTALKARIAELGLTMSDHLKGPVRRDLDCNRIPQIGEIARPSNLVHQPSDPRKQRRQVVPDPRVPPEKHLGLDLLTLAAWYVGFLAVIQYVHPADASLVARHYTPTDDTTRPAVLRQALRGVVLEIARQIPRWAKQVTDFFNG